MNQCRRVLRRGWHQITQLPENTMATYQWTTLTTGQTVTFNSGLDLLDFGSLNANAVRLVGLTPTSTLFIAGGKSVTVSGLGITQIVSRDIFSSTFQNVRTSGQSRIIVGDNSTANGDDGANDITLSGFAEGNLVRPRWQRYTPW